MTWEETRDAAGPGSVAILPVGAIEAHGPHLPLETDVIIAQAMARSGAARLAVGPPAERRVPERRLPRRPVRDFDSAGRAPGAGARGHQGRAATHSGIAFPCHPRWQAELRGGGRRSGLLRVSGPGYG